MCQFLVLNMVGPNRVFSFVAHIFSIYQFECLCNLCIGC